MIKSNSDKKHTKPHLTIKYGVWVCRRVRSLTGVGITPESALEQWTERNGLCWRSE